MEVIAFVAVAHSSVVAHISAAEPVEAIAAVAADHFFVAARISAAEPVTAFAPLVVGPAPVAGQLAASSAPLVACPLAGEVARLAASSAPLVDDLLAAAVAKLAGFVSPHEDDLKDDLAPRVELSSARLAVRLAQPFGDFDLGQVAQASYDVRSNYLVVEMHRFVRCVPSHEFHFRQFYLRIDWQAVQAFPLPDELSTPYRLVGRDFLPWIGLTDRLAYPHVDLCLNLYRVVHHDYLVSNALLWV